MQYNTIFKWDQTFITNPHLITNPLLLLSHWCRNWGEPKKRSRWTREDFSKSKKRTKDIIQNTTHQIIGSSKSSINLQTSLDNSFTRCHQRVDKVSIATNEISFPDFQIITMSRLKRKCTVTSWIDKSNTRGKRVSRNKEGNSWQTMFGWMFWKEDLAIVEMTGLGLLESGRTEAERSKWWMRVGTVERSRWGTRDQPG